MHLSHLLSLSVLAPLVACHFEVNYPGWRGDSFLEPLSQWDYPCAGADETSNRTDWPMDGGSIKLDLHHPWTYVFINLGVGNNITNFNISLSNEMLWNETGNGTLCWNKVTLPTDIGIQDGTNATLQFVTSGESGSALYNCADITFRSNATLLPSDQCQNSSNIRVDVVNGGGQSQTSSNSSPASSSTSAAVSTSIATAFMVLSIGVVGSLMLWM